MRSKPLMTVKYGFTETEPWHNVNTHSPTPPKDKVQISYKMQKDSLSAFQKAVKSAKSKHFSKLIAKNNHSPKVLFSVSRLVRFTVIV